MHMAAQNRRIVLVRTRSQREKHFLFIAASHERNTRTHMAEYQPNTCGRKMLGEVENPKATMQRKPSMRGESRRRRHDSLVWLQY